MARRRQLYEGKAKILFEGPEVAGRVPAELLDAAMDSKLHLRQIEAIYTRVFGEAGPAA